MEVEFGPCRAVTEGPAGQSMWRGGSGRCPWCWRRRPGALRGAARPGRAGDRGRGAAGRGEAVAERSTAVSALPQSVCKHWSALLAGLALAFLGSKNIPTEGRRKRNTNNHVGYSCSEESFGRGSRNEQKNGNTH